jgi:uncharacterized membrane protein YhaH (DUF805 family)
MVDTPVQWPVVDQVKTPIPPELSGAVQKATQVVWTVTQAVWAVGQQFASLSKAVWADELAAQASDRISPMKVFVIHTLKVAFFIEDEQRITRGEYVIGSLSVILLVWLLSGLLAIILWKMWVWLWFGLMTIPLANLAIKRFHDLNRSGWWAMILLIPFVWLVMPVLFKWVNENNIYGPDPLWHVPSDDEWYIITALMLFIISSILTTILWFVGISTSAPTIDPTDPLMIGEENVIGTQTNNLQQKATNTVTTTTKKIIK